MLIKEIQGKIKELKEKKDICILAHSYQGQEILEVADYTGDSYKLSVDAKNCSQENIILCGVKFMAETAKILSPHKRVFMPNKEAGCPMAEQMEPELIEMFKKIEPDRKIVAYINTTAKLKTLSDVCVTSSSAVKIVNAMPDKKLLFIPDCNLGGYVRDRVKDKDIKLLQGGCPVHAAVNAADVEKAKKRHPDSLVLVHPECQPEVVEIADFTGSTSEIMNFARKSEHNNFIIGTEISITEHLQFEMPEKNFFNLSKKIMCPNMKITTLIDVYRTVTDLENAYEIDLSDEDISKAKGCIDKMLELG
ncbi:MAG: quinolinate synthase NadA [Ruminococcus sp.]|nr:quinolinate synthase NadA [Ruminococcus sp.]